MNWNYFVVNHPCIKERQRSRSKIINKTGRKSPGFIDDAEQT
jgi:hypothetical protein